MNEVKANTKTEENPMITVDGFKLKKLSIISTFSDNKKIDKAIDKFREDALSIVPDLTTKKGRDAVASIAYKISKKKTSIVSQMIDPSIEDAKAIVTSVGKGKSHFKTKMDELRDEVRKPLNEWEEAEKIKEKKRIDDIQLKITGINNIVYFDQNNLPGKDEITELIESVDCIDCEEGFDEFTQDALQAKSKAKEILAEMLNKIIQKEIADKAAEELELKEAELKAQHLKQQAQERLNKLMMIPTTMFGKTSEEIQTKIDSIESFTIKQSEFGEFTQQASDSVITVVNQLGAMLAQVKFMEEAQKPVVTDAVDNSLPLETIRHQEKKPVEQRLAEKFAEVKEEPVNDDQKELTPKEQMNKQLKFWKDQYGVRVNEFNDLMNIINQYI